MRTTFDWPDPPDDEHGDVTVVNFAGKKVLDEQNFQVIGNDLFQLVDEQGRRKLLLNFSSVEYVSSAALGKLIRLQNRLAQVHGKLVLCSISKGLLEIFTLTKLDKFFMIAKDKKAGLAMF